MNYDMEVPVKIHLIEKKRYIMVWCIDFVFNIKFCLHSGKEKSYGTEQQHINN